MEHRVAFIRELYASLSIPLKPHLSADLRPINPLSLSQG